MTTPGTEPTPSDDVAAATQLTDALPVPGAAGEAAPAAEPPAPAMPGPDTPVSPAVMLPPMSPVGVPAMAGAQTWSRSAGAVGSRSAPTSNFPAGYGSHSGYGSPSGYQSYDAYGLGSPPPSFDAPGYGYPADPSWARAIDGPKAWPVAVYTLLFGIFGALSAARRSSDARALGLPVGRYWGVFAGALVGSVAAWTLVVGVVLAVTVPLYLNALATVMTTTELEQELESANSGGDSVTDATCIEEAVDPVGVGTYTCLLLFDDGTDRPYRITVSDDGTWSASATD